LTFYPFLFLLFGEDAFFFVLGTNRHIPFPFFLGFCLFSPKGMGSRTSAPATVSATVSATLSATVSATVGPLDYPRPVLADTVCEDVWGERRETATATSEDFIECGDQEDALRQLVGARMAYFTVRVQWMCRDESSYASGLVFQYCCGQPPLHTSSDWWVVTVATTQEPQKRYDSVNVDFFLRKFMVPMTMPVTVPGDMASCCVLPCSTLTSDTFVVFRYDEMKS
jgi:hypothetical protein